MQVYNQKKSISIQVLTAVCIVLMLSTGAFAYLAWQEKLDSDSAASKQAELQSKLDSMKVSTPTPSTDTSSQTPDSTNKQSSIKTKLYFGNGSDGNYNLIDLTTGKSQDFIPKGYKVVMANEYEQEPTHLILQKDDSLYSYTVADSTIKKIELPEKLNNSHNIILNPSISEKAKFYMVVQETKESDGMMGYEVINSKSYYYNALTNTLQANSDPTLPGGNKASGCFEYDSKFSRFFNWSCGEGIGQALPLSVYDTKTQASTKLMNFQDFGLSSGEDELVSVKYNNGYFVGVPRVQDKANKIVIVKPSSTISKDVLNIPSSVKNSLYATNSGHYGFLYIPEKSALVTGGANDVNILTFDSSKNIISHKELPEKGVYANFLYTKDGNLYFKNQGNVKIVNLDNNKIEKTYTTTLKEAVTLISLPE